MYIPSWGCKFVGKSYPQKTQTLVLTNNGDSTLHVQCITDLKNSNFGNEIQLYRIKFYWVANRQTFDPIQFLPDIIHRLHHWTVCVTNRQRRPQHSHHHHEQRSVKCNQVHVNCLSFGCLYTRMKKKPRHFTLINQFIKWHKCSLLFK